TAVGEGFTIEDMNAEVTARIKSLELMGYEYRDVIVNGKIADRSFNGDITIDDEAIALSFIGKAGLDIENPDYNFILNVKYADLQELNLYDDDLKFSGKVTGDFTGNELSTLNGTIYITGASIAKDKTIIPLDSISLVATSMEGRYDWKLRSAIVDADYSGTSSAAIGVPLLINHFNYYFNQQSYREADTLGHQQFDFLIDIHDQKNLFPVFISGLESIQPLQIKGSFNHSSKKLDVISTPADIIYSGILLDSLVLFASSTQERLNYSIAANKIQRDTLEVNGLSVSGYIQHDSIRTLLSIKPDSNQVDFLLGGSLSTIGKNFRVHLLPDQLVFENEKWSVPSDNFIQFGPEGIQAHNLKISNADSYLMVQSTEERANSPVDFTFNKFDLKTFSRIIDTSEQIITGIINGNFLLKDYKNFTFSSALAITDFSFLGEKYGNLDLNAENNEPGKYDVKLRLLGAGNGIALDGFYKSSNQSNELHFDALIDSANFSLIETFANPYIRDLQGSMKGKLSVRGSTNSPSINGTIRFDTARFVVSFTNSALSLGKEPITFDDSGIHFNSVTVHDGLGGKAIVNGDLFTADYQDFQFAIDVSANDFVAMNSTSEVMSDYYGVLRLDCIAKLRGDINRPSIGIKLKLREGTNLTYIYQRSDTSYNTEEGIVEFVDVGQRLDSLLAEKDSLQSILSGYDISAFL
ncbi:MAG: translocation/assembly module TamB domain-containing protein, partial [Chitinophagales bacterium]